MSSAPSGRRKRAQAANAAASRWSLVLLNRAAESEKSSQSIKVSGNQMKTDGLFEM